MALDEDFTVDDDAPCVVCGHNPCDCDEQYDRWKERER